MEIVLLSHILALNCGRLLELWTKRAEQVHNRGGSSREEGVPKVVRRSNQISKREQTVQESRWATAERYLSLLLQSCYEQKFRVLFQSDLSHPRCGFGQSQLRSSWPSASQHSNGERRRVPWGLLSSQGENGLQPTWYRQTQEHILALQTQISGRKWDRIELPIKFVISEP